MAQNKGKRCLTYYQKKGWTEQYLPKITTYPTPLELYREIQTLLEQLPRADWPSERKLQSLKEEDMFNFSRTLGTNEWVSLMVEDSNGTENVAIFALHDGGFLVVTETGSGEYWLYSNWNDLEYDLMNYTIRRVDLVLYDVRRELWVTEIYDSEFPFDYFLDGKEVSKEMYEKYQQDFLELSNSELERYIIPDITNMVSGYLNEY